MSTPSKSRLIAKEAVCSRWARRANIFFRSNSNSMANSMDTSESTLHREGMSVEFCPATTAKRSVSLKNISSHDKLDVLQVQSQPLNYNQTKQTMNAICQMWHTLRSFLNGLVHPHLWFDQSSNNATKSLSKELTTLTNRNSTAKTNTPPQPFISNSYPIHANPNSKMGKRASTLSRTNLSESLANIQISSALQSHLDHYRRPSPTSASTSHERRYSSCCEVGMVNVIDKCPQPQRKHPNDTTVLLDILPTGYDRIMAWSTTALHRNRAFLLLDLGGVIRSHARFASLCGVRSIRMISIQPQFCVTKNPNVELLRLLTRLGVDLRCSSVHDVLAVREAFGECSCVRTSVHTSVTQNGCDYSVDHQHVNRNKVGNGIARLVDDVSRTRKPNGYLRRLFQDNMYKNGQRRRRGLDSHINDDEYLTHLAVDGPDEVKRISDTMSRILPRIQNNREGEKEEKKGTIGYILRFPNDCNIILTDRTWENLVLTTYTATVKTGDRLVGVSVDLSPWSRALVTDTEMASANRVLMNVCKHLRLFRLLLLSVGQARIRIDLTDLPTPFTRDLVECLTHALETLVSSDVTIDELVKVHVVHNCDKEHSVGVTAGRLQNLLEVTNTRHTDPSAGVSYTADVSEHLVADSGALCTRIIGKKVTKKVRTTEANFSKKKEGEAEVHYYIDDGCYGSLGSSCKSVNINTMEHNGVADGTTQIHTEKGERRHMPIPLYGDHGKDTTKRSRPQHTYTRKRTISNDDYLKLSPWKNTTSPPTDIGGYVNATVWGPTCDGLDKVCKSVQLPGDLEANQDWLVFPHLGCGGFGGGFGLGTAFNGIDPPDTAYCVLDYFSRDFNDALMSG